MILAFSSLMFTTLHRMIKRETYEDGDKEDTTEEEEEWVVVVVVVVKVEKEVVEEKEFFRLQWMR
jgi:hypothetical protein